MQIISVINQKGGVGKTTTVINLAAGLTQLNKKILVIDLDPQGNATTGLGLSNVDNSSDTIYGVLNGTREINDIIKKTQFENLDIITSNVDLSGLEVETAHDRNRAFILKAKLSSYLNNSRGSYDYIIIDCPPMEKFRHHLRFDGCRIGFGGDFNSRGKAKGFFRMADDFTDDVWWH